MFEECFSMIELYGIGERGRISFEPARDEFDVDDLTRMLVNALEKALMEGEDSHPTRTH